ncbi:Protein SERAC1, partial [Colletotrichum gloeosporioides]
MCKPKSIHPWFSFTFLPVAKIGFHSIVAVHGLGGDWEGTWTSNGRLWLRDFVPSQLPSARVWSFGYDSSILSQTVADINDVAISLLDSLDGERSRTSSTGKPIIFVAHSLGGVIVKRVLNLARERTNHWRDVQKSTLGLMFFGVPHRGADDAYWGEFASRLLSALSLGTWGNSRFVQGLKRNSPEFSSISRAFVEPGSEIKVIRTFYETKKMGNRIIVDKDSATLHTTNEKAVPIQDANHREMCKFDAEASQKYRAVRNALEEIVTSCTQGIAVDFSNLKVWTDKYIQLAFPVRVKVLSSTAPDMTVHKWVCAMPQAREWRSSENFSTLYVEYQASSEWHVSTSQNISMNLKVKDAEVIWGFAPDDKQKRQSESWKSLLPRLLISQLFSLSRKCIGAMEGIIQSLAPNEGLTDSWKLLYCSENPPSEHMWTLLACAMEALGRPVLVSLVGFDAELSQPLDEALLCLHQLLYRSSSKDRLEADETAPHKVLVVSNPRPRAQKSGPPVQFRPAQSLRIDEDAERRETTELIEANNEAECLLSLCSGPRQNAVDEPEVGTTDWIRGHEVYNAWLANKSTLLWIHGKPGSGKSTIGTSLSRHLRKSADKNLIADYFYSSRGDRLEADHVSMLRSILHQILSQDATLYAAYRDGFRESHRQDNFNWEFEQLEKVLLSIPDLECHGRGGNRTIFLILDGLDESSDNLLSKQTRERVFGLFATLCKFDKPKIFKIITLSRPEISIKNAIRPTHIIDMKNERNCDINIIVETRLSRLWRYLMSDNDNSIAPGTLHTSSYQLGFIREHLLENADGVVLWVIMVLRQLEEHASSPASTVASLRKALHKIPTSVEGLYEDILARLGANPSSDFPKANYIFSWLLFCGKALKLCEMRDALAMFDWDDSPHHQERFLEKHRIILPRGKWERMTILLNDLCGGFIEIIPHQSSSSRGPMTEYDTDPKDLVQLVHSTARNFLLGRNGTSFVQISNDRSLDIICSACVNYFSLTLDMPDCGGLNESWESFVHRLESSPLLEYILSVFPGLLDQHATSCSISNRLLRQMIASKMTTAKRDRWSSVTWWLFRPWMEKVFPDHSLISIHHHYEIVMFQDFTRSRSKFLEFLIEWAHSDAEGTAGDTF